MIQHNISQPVFGCVEVSSLCNYRCKMCYCWKNKKEDWPFSADEFIAVLEDIKKYVKQKKLDFTIFGGEPLLWKEIDRFFEKIDKRKFIPILNTNCSMITKDRIMRLNNCGVENYILSLDSIDPEIHDYYRGISGAFEKVMKTIDLIDEIYQGRQNITILPVIMEKNYRDLHKLIKWVISNPKVQRVSLQAVLPNIGSTGKIEEDPMYKDIWPNDPEKAAREIKRIIVMKKLGYSRIINNPDSQLEAYIRYYKNPRAKFLGDTKFFSTYFTIRANGDLEISGQNAGNLKQNSFSDLWESEKSTMLRKKVYDNQIPTYWFINTQQAFEIDRPDIFNYSRGIGIMHEDSQKVTTSENPIHQYISPDNPPAFSVYNSGRKLRIKSQIEKALGKKDKT